MSLLDAQIQPLTPLVDEFAGRLFGELDYIQEGLNAERFQVLQDFHPPPLLVRKFTSGTPPALPKLGHELSHATV